MIVDVARREHWETVYRDKADAQLSWFQAEPSASLALIRSLRPAPRRVIDVGGGQSALAGELVSSGVEEVTVLDISDAAISRARERLGERATRVRWLTADVLESPDLGAFDLWHDRAVFHFLTDPGDRMRYADAVRRSVPSGGHVIMATFAPTGPEKCSGLPVRRYDARGIASELGESFRLLDSASESHATPWGKTQDFVYALLGRS
jgi:2-polyprenyl-3-methyl-5-hydroxy-6-metoxy-1,4-benzoquinol methylase